MKPIDPSGKHLHFVTGRLAEHALRSTVQQLAGELDFNYSIDVLPITVAALMTPGWIAPRLALVGRFIDVNGLVDFNVSGALNANYEFYFGLVDGGAFPFEMTEEQVLADVWSQEDEIRAETEDWLYSYLAMAYEPVSDADLTAYIDMSETAAGKALNQALFAAFDVLYRQISRDLGLAAAQMVAGEDI